MKKDLTWKTKIKTLTLFLIILISSFYINNLVNFSSKSSSSENDSEDYDEYSEINPVETIKSPQLSSLGNDSWWDYSFGYRRLIKVTNPYPVNFTDYAVNITFNYAELVQSGKIQPDLDDIRIVENGVLRSYIVIKDFPSINYATIFFDTNITKNVFEVDTYLYFGNTNAINAESRDPLNSFGLVKNGDFELDINFDPKYTPYGWTFSHNPVDYINSVYNPAGEGNYSNDSYNNFENRLLNATITDNAERIYQGNYAYKFGTKQDVLAITGLCYDYAGTLFSYPFKVPYVDGGEIYLKVYRNIRTWGFSKNKNQDLDYDGYFIRICNGSDPEYTTDPDYHVQIGDYIDLYGGRAEVKGNPNNPTNWKFTTQLQNWENTVVMDTLSESSSDGDLTGQININLSDYQGQSIFLELGVWGTETEHRSAFFQLDAIEFNYSLATSIDEIQAYNSNITVITKDIDGRIVPNAEVIIINNSVAKGASGYEINKGITSNGRITFTNIMNGRYNITANYTLGSKEEEVFNSFEDGSGPYYFNGINYIVEIYLDLWTFDFEITDWDGYPLTLGYIEVNESVGGDLLATLPLDSNGKATFRWINTTSYYYKVYYDNNDYSNEFSPVALNESYIYRNLYDTEKYNGISIKVNETNKAPPSQKRYYISETVYSDGSTANFGNKKIINANITLTDMTTRIHNVSIYYLDKNNSTGSGNQNLIYFEEGYGSFEDNDFISLDFMTVDNSKLASDNYNAYGILIIVNGENNSQCNGIIKVDIKTTYNIENKTALARINMRVIEISQGNPLGDPRSAIIKVIDPTGKSLINITSESINDGYAYDSNGVPFWYLRGLRYNYSIDVANITDAFFNITLVDPPQWIPGPGQKIQQYNYTLYENSSITFNLRLEGTGINLTLYETTFLDAYGTSEVFWGQNLTFWVNFTKSSDGGITWISVTEIGVYCTITIVLVGDNEILIAEQLREIGNGNFSITINSSRLSAGYREEFYNFEINGFHPTYDDPKAQPFLVKIKAIPTGISAYDYDTHQILPNKFYSQHFNEIINITIRYYISSSNIDLIDATLTYQWIGLNPIKIISDPVNEGFFYFTINTSDAQSIGIETISITATLENYSMQSNIIVYINILNRHTTLNDRPYGLFRTYNVWVGDTELITYRYEDDDKQELIAGARAYYFWYDYKNGNPVEGSGGSGDLIKNTDYTYTFDFNTDIRATGEYYIEIHLEKDNYEPRTATMILKIMLREFDADIGATNLKNDQINVVKGDDIEFEIELLDKTRGNIPLTGAKVTLEIGDEEYEFEEDKPGVYVLTFKTNKIEAFYTSRTFTAQISIKKANFTSQEEDITIVVEMEQIFEGIPTFYFIMLIAIISGVVGSLVSYRVIQQARIPVYVKKLRKVKSIIKAGKPITESYAIPTAEKMIIKQFGKDWEKVGYSLESIYGIKEGKSLESDKNKITKMKGDNI